MSDKKWPDVSDDDEDGESDEAGDKDFSIRPDNNESSSKLDQLRNDFAHPYFANMEQIDFLFRLGPVDNLVRTRLFVRGGKITMSNFELYVENATRDSPLLSASPKGSIAGVQFNINANLLDPHVHLYRAYKLGKFF